MNCLSVDQLAFERNDLFVFSGLNASWKAGDIVQLMGHNGCGKSTLMRIIAGLLNPFSGHVRWNGAAPSSFDFNAALLYLGHQVGVKQTLTPLENLRWYFGLNGIKRFDSSNSGGAPEQVSEARCREALAKLGLHAYVDTPCYQLSAGQQRRAALARLFISEAPLWVLDEPFTAIDVNGVQVLEQRLEQHAENGGLVLLTSHQAWQSPRVIKFNLEQYKVGSGV